MLSQKHMSFEKNWLQTLPTSTSYYDHYFWHFYEIFAAFIIGEVQVDDVFIELEKINKLYDIDEWINEANSQWFGN
jgi:endoglucanase Acf2